MSLILYNNKLVSGPKAQISFTSEAFQFGYGVFETLRTKNNKKVLQGKEHIQRLLNSAKKIDLKIKYNEKELIKMLEKISQISKPKIQKIKIIAVKEGIILLSEVLKINPEIYANGVNCITVKCLRSMPEIKSISYLPSYLSHKTALDKNCYEAILIDANEEVYEGAYSNIFWFEEKILCTRRENVLQGITAKTVIKNAPFKIKFKSISLRDLLMKREIFLTQTTKGIVPITKINNTKIGSGLPGENTKTAIEIFQKKLY